MKLALVWLGKTKSPRMRAWTQEWEQRLGGFGRFASVRCEELAGREPQQQLLRRAQGARLWLCDPAGRSWDSPGFARFLERETATHAGREVVLAIGGADGFGAEVGGAAAGGISLSALTFSHELTRLVALEQIYRALAILTHHPYPH